MLTAVLKTLDDMTAPGFRSVLWKSLGLTIVLFVAIFAGLEMALSMITLFPWPWLSTALAVFTGGIVIAAMFFLIAPVTGVFAGLFLDDIAELVERRDYGGDAPGRALPFGLSVVTGVQFGLVLLAVNVALLPSLLLGFGAFFMIVANGYLLGREYFSLIALRHLAPREAKTVRQMNAGRVFAAGLVPAGLALVPVVNVLTPMFATAYFVHIFKQINHDDVAARVAAPR